MTTRTLTRRVVLEVEPPAGFEPATCAKAHEPCYGVRFRPLSHGGLETEKGHRKYTVWPFSWSNVTRQERPPWPFSQEIQLSKEDPQSWCCGSSLLTVLEVVDRTGDFPLWQLLHPNSQLSHVYDPASLTSNIRSG